MFGIDDMAVVEVEVKGVVGLTRIVRVKALGFLPGNDLALILQHLIAGLDGKDGIDTLAVDARFAHLGAATTGRRAEAGMGLAAVGLNFFLACINGK